MNMKNLLVGHAIRLKYVTRFSTCRTLHKESVAEHSYYTALYSIVVAKWVTDHTDLRIDVAKLLTKALVHDLEESITGDIPRDFKHVDKELRASIERIAETSFLKAAESIFQCNTNYWLSVWKSAKDDTVEGRILAFADFLSVVSYIYEEVRIASSISLKEQLISLQSYYEGFLDKKYAFIRPLVLLIGDILKEIFDD